MKRLALLAVVVVVGCRTTVAVEHQPPPPNIFVSKDTGCEVHDYPSATDVPEGSTSLGVVQVPREQVDEDTYVKLREAICAKGGNGLSSLHWVSETSKEAPMIYALEANAWVLPEGGAYKER